MSATDDRYLFRGKRTVGGEWVRGYYGPRVIGGMSGPRVYMSIARQSGPCQIDYAEVDPATIGQCTGLRDKGGRLIFEGDILKIHVYLDDGSYDDVSYDEVYWCPNSAAYYITTNGVKDGQGQLGEVHDDKEVVGNIHDNLELLEVSA